MAERSAPSGRPGVIPLEWARDLKEGMSAQAVRECVGPPVVVLRPDEIKTPSQVFEEIGSTFRFAADQDLEEIWEYVHDRRGRMTLVKRVTTRVGFRNGVVAALWRVVSPSD